MYGETQAATVNACDPHPPFGRVQLIDVALKDMQEPNTHWLLGNAY